MVLLKDLVLEIGESTIKPYKFKEVDIESRTIYIEFTTKMGTLYQVELESRSWKGLPAMGIEFKTESGTTSTVTNEGDILRIMSTILAIIKKYLNKYKDVKYLMYAPAHKPGEASVNNQRDMIYKRFIMKQYPEAKILTQSKFIIIEI